MVCRRRAIGNSSTVSPSNLRHFRPGTPGARRAGGPDPWLLPGALYLDLDLDVELDVELALDLELAFCLTLTLGVTTTEASRAICSRPADTIGGLPSSA
jgi:hypothetical protein